MQSRQIDVAGQHKSLRARRGGIATVLFLAVGVTTLAPTANAGQTKTGTSYSVVVNENQTVDQALLALSVQRPDLSAAIRETAVNKGNGLVNPTALVGWLDNEHVTPGAGMKAAGVASDQAIQMRRSAGPTPVVAGVTPATAGTSSFFGTMTESGFDCNSQDGCYLASVLNFLATYNMGWTTYGVVSKTDNSSYWSAKTASGYCSIGLHSSCSSTNTYNTSISYVGKLFSFTTGMSGRTARVLTSFRASWRGVPGSTLSGYTPYFTCTSSDQICRFTS